MNNTTKIEWNKSGNWTSLEGPMYTAKSISTARVAIVGTFYTSGDNHDGWRKTRIYQLRIDGKPINSGDLKKMMELASKMAL